MENILPHHLPEVVFSSSDSKISKQLSQLVKKGRLRKIAPRVYSPNFRDSAEDIVRRNLFTILGALYPGALLSHRSAIEFAPSQENHLFLTYTYTKKIELAGIVLRFIQGPGAIEGDNIIQGQLYVSQKERALLENLQTSKQKGGVSKNLAQEQIEQQLESIIRINGEEGLNQLRDRARFIAKNLEMNHEFERLNRLISALLSTKPSRILSSPIALARALGHPFDSHRIELFEKLFIALKNKELGELPEKNTTEKAFKNFAFYESYFSNYIEGTVFELDEALEIIEKEQPMPTRNEDSHDVLGTYKLVSNKYEMSISPSNAEEFIEILKRRHRILLEARQSKNPGQFKDKNNRAGETFFVDQTLVRGTLIKGFNYYQSLTHPFSRAIYIMFLISEVHPFLDGNGRIARVMMNAELVKNNQSKIIIPTVYREDYLGGLRKLTRNSNPEVFIKMMLRAWEFSATLIGEDRMSMENTMLKSNAFKESDEARLIIIKHPQTF